MEISHVSYLGALGKVGTLGTLPVKSATQRLGNPQELRIYNKLAPASSQIESTGISFYDHEPLGADIPLRFPKVVYCSLWSVCFALVPRRPLVAAWQLGNVGEGRFPLYRCGQVCLRAARQGPSPMSECCPLALATIMFRLDLSLPWCRLGKLGKSQ